MEIVILKYINNVYYLYFYFVFYEVISKGFRKQSTYRVLSAVNSITYVRGTGSRSF